MALIKCPECGAEISSNAKQCVKCGCEITCCPECLTVYSGKVEVCENCGYEITSQVGKAEMSLEMQTKKINKMIDRDFKLSKKFSIAMKIADALPFVLLFACIAIFIAWNSKTDIEEKLKGMNSVYNNIKTLSIITVILFIIDVSFMKFAELFFDTRRNTWIKEQKFDCRAYIKKYRVFGMQSEEAEAYREAIKSSCFTLENPREKLYYIVVIATQTVLFVIAGICACVWFLDNFKHYLTVKFYDLQASYSWQFNAVFIVAVICLALAILVDIFGDTPMNKRYKKWSEEFDK